MNEEQMMSVRKENGLLREALTKLVGETREVLSTEELLERGRKCVTYTPLEEVSVPPGLVIVHEDGRWKLYQRGDYSLLPARLILEQSGRQIVERSSLWVDGQDLPFVAYKALAWAIAHHRRPEHRHWSARVKVRDFTLTPREVSDEWILQLDMPTSAKLDAVIGLIPEVDTQPLVDKGLARFRGRVEGALQNELGSTLSEEKWTSAAAWAAKATLQASVMEKLNFLASSARVFGGEGEFKKEQQAQVDDLRDLLTRPLGGEGFK